MKTFIIIGSNIDCDLRVEIRALSEQDAINQFKQRYETAGIVCVIKK